jgi:hypothetical protein
LGLNKGTVSEVEKGFTLLVVHHSETTNIVQENKGSKEQKKSLKFNGIPTLT